MAKRSQQRPRGLLYNEMPPVRGKHLFRVRETHLRDHIAPLLRHNIGTAKLDLLLRGLALLPQHLGARRTPPGLVLPGVRYELLHDLCRGNTHFRGRQTASEISLQQELEQKSGWVREQLQRLEGMNLVHRAGTRHGRPTLLVRSDRGDGSPYDDPDGSDGPFVTLHGAVIACGAWARSGGDVLAFL